MPSKEPRVNLQSISKREREILNLLAEGYKSKEIADGLNLNVRTVENHLYNLMRKTNQHNTSSLLDYALAKKVVDVYDILESYFQKRTLKQKRNNLESARHPFLT